MAADRRHDDFVAVYDEHVWDVYGYLGYRIGSREAAEDLTQATFERALRAWDRFDPKRASERTWLLSIAHNLMVDHYRRERHEESLEERHDLEPALTADDRPTLGVSPELEGALNQLGERERHLIALRFGGDLNGPEIATLTGLSLANVQQILSRAIRKMREHLGEKEAARASLG